MKPAQAKEAAEKTEKVLQDPMDELCPNKDYDNAKEAIVVNAADDARNKLVEKVIISPLNRSSETKATVEAEIMEKFEAIGVTVKVMNTKSTAFGKFSGSVVEISPVNLNTIWGRRLGLENCSIIAFDE